MTGRLRPGGCLKEPRRSPWFGWSAWHRRSCHPSGSVIPMWSSAVNHVGFYFFLYGGFPYIGIQKIILNGWRSKPLFPKPSALQRLHGGATLGEYMFCSIMTLRKIDEAPFYIVIYTIARHRSSQPKRCSFSKGSLSKASWISLELTHQCANAIRFSILRILCQQCSSELQLVPGVVSLPRRAHR